MVGPVHIDDRDPGRGQDPGEFGAVGAGALHFHRGERAVRAHPVQQVAVATDGGGELPVGEVSADPVDHRGVVGHAVGVDSAGDLRDVVRHAGHVRPCVSVPAGAGRDKRRLQLGHPLVRILRGVERDLPVCPLNW